MCPPDPPLTPHPHALDQWERRAPLCPSHVKQMVEKGMRVIVQPCTRRVYNDAEYSAAGAELSSDLSPASVILGVKQVPQAEILNDKTYVFFSHVIKGQEENMPLLDTILERNVRLIDYECITDTGNRGDPRTIAFGEFAGMAGMIDSLRGVGEKMLASG